MPESLRFNIVIMMVADALASVIARTYPPQSIPDSDCPEMSLIQYISSRSLFTCSHDFLHFHTYDVPSIVFRIQDVPSIVFPASGLHCAYTYLKWRKSSEQIVERSCTPAHAHANICIYWIRKNRDYVYNVRVKSWLRGKIIAKTWVTY